MKTYVFGDSFSVEFDNPNLFPPGNIYCDWKGYVPKKYYHLLSENFGSSEIINYSISGNDNENIFEKFTEVYEKIETNDLVIFGWTVLHRFSICNNVKSEDNRYNMWGSSVSHSTTEWVLKTSQNKSTILYYERQMKLIKFINQILKTNRVVHWSWYEGLDENSNKTIAYETKGTINDYHYNEKTHLELCNRMLDLFKESDKVELDLWDINKLPRENLAFK